MGGLLGGSLQRRLWIISFSPVLSKKLDFYTMAGILGDIGLLLAGWDGQTGWDRGRMEGPKLEGARSGSLPLSLEARTAGSGRRRR